MGGFFPDEIIDEIKDRNNIVDIIAQYIQVKASGGATYKALCPFHNEKTPSFVINSQKQIFKCFGCGEGGDVIGFIMKMENLDFIDAIKLLAERSNIHLEELNNSEELKKDIQQKVLYFDIHKKAAIYYYNNLTKGKNPALNYLSKRGLTPKIIKSFGIGYAYNSWKDLMNYLVNEGYQIQDIEKCGLILKNKDGTDYYDRFRNRVIFPIFDIRGNVIGFGGRVLDDSLPKYLNSPETPVFNKSSTIYGLNFARKHITDGKIILVEGYMDVIALCQRGFNNVVAALGTSLTKYHAQILKKYSSEVIIAFDGDEAGIKATLRSVDIMKEVGLNCKVLLLPSNKDPDDFIKEMGKYAFQNQLDKAVSPIDLKIIQAKKKFNLDKPEGKIDFVKELAEILKQIKSPVEREVYVQKIEKEIGVSQQAIHMEIYGNKGTTPFDKNPKYSSSYKRDNKYIEAVPPVEQKGHLTAEKQLIKLMLVKPDVRPLIIKKVQPEDFSLGKHQIIVEYIVDHYQWGPQEIVKGLPQLQQDIENILQIDIEHINIAKTLEKYVVNMKRFKLMYQAKELQHQQKVLKENKKLDQEEVEKELLKIGMEIVRINTEIQRLQL
ncbi:DNA primase [Alkaliphilus hydrothermalis]|uniref:DNA primase n=1 Tax=Alkaliphilus hydrothermalis TaxID=1482730 RepID=A0ABS2NNV9_9FIRM|nr:DNA primase [Alkaliphilus hydrothermalis]MBM7614630.1 DNA primase [Alkaliphilus hydrothermalis]